jgi:hypothetical protein
MTSSELIDAVKIDVKGLTSYLADDDYDEAVADAERETGFTMPVTTSFQIQWMKRRTRRHLLSILVYDAARKFRAETFFINQRFEHYIKLLEMEDKAFAEALEADAFEFAGVSAFKVFGTKIEAGFQYDDVGRDTTYTDDNAVIFAPTDDS